jgi:hypothetical protein
LIVVSDLNGKFLADPFLPVSAVSLQAQMPHTYFVSLRYYSGVVFVLVYYTIITQNGLILIVMSAYNGKNESSRELRCCQLLTAFFGQSLAKIWALGKKNGSSVILNFLMAFAICLQEHVFLCTFQFINLNFARHSKETAN